MADDSFDLAAELSSLSLDTDVYAGYVTGIMDDEDTGSLEERVEAVLELLGSAIVGSNATEEDLEGLATKLRTQWQASKDAEAAQAASIADAGKEEEVRRYQERLAQDKKAAQEEQDRQAEELRARNRGARGAARDREALLNKYSFDADNLVDEEGNLVATAGGGKKGAGGDADEALGNLLGANSNKAQVEAAARALRDKAKAEHAKKVLREKELLEKDKIKKEAEKRRTQKKEKVRYVLECGHVWAYMHVHPLSQHRQLIPRHPSPYSLTATRVWMSIRGARCGEPK